MATVLGLTTIFALIYGSRVLSSGLWLDESITAWVTDGGLSQCVDRAWNFQGQSPLYFIVVWGLRQVLGDSELGLRLLSVVSTVGAVVIFFGIQRELRVGRDAWLGATAFALALWTHPDVALTARPYAAAVFFAVLATFLLLRMLKTESWVDPLGYTLAVATTISLHYVFATVLGFHLLLFCVTRYGHVTRRLVFRWIGCLICVAVLCVPLLPHLLLVREKATRYEISLPPRVHDLLYQSFVSDGLMPLAILVAGFGLLRPKLNFAAVDQDVVRIGVVWWIAGPLSIYCVYHLLGISLNVPRYYLWRLPAIGLLAVAGIQAVYPHRLVAAPTLLLLTFMVPAWQNVDRSGWREAIQWASLPGRLNDNCRVVVYSGLIESAEPGWLKDDSYRPYFLAPLKHYRVPGSADVLPILIPSTESFFDAEVDKIVCQRSQLVFYLDRNSPAGERLKQRLSQAGWTVDQCQQFRLAEVIVARSGSE
ncbi:glycosyltransferase family 39 protein [Roseiconus nitratireducens]|uniref:glycosyltransferase family 39 protein n=1 Tax=Roseiconus nitratireducens TaxID=2605748 RepID=UPI0013755359|nr:glycosyltransferase family 39 protein [Roseiconus nitratireducens]